MNLWGAMNIIDEKKEVLNLFENGKDVVLSTSSNDIVTSRTVTCLSFENDLYVISIERPGATKLEQISVNSNVAINSNTIQITANAIITGYCNDEINEKFMEQYKEKLPESYYRFALIPTCVVIKMDLKTYKNWEMINGSIESKVVDFVNETIDTKTI